MVIEPDLFEKRPYTLQSESRRIYDSIWSDSRLQVPAEVKALADRVRFAGDETQPFYPVPHKCAEAQAGILGVIGLFALAIAKERHDIDQEVEIDVSHALLGGLGALFTRHEGEWLSGSPKMVGAVQRWDHGKTRELYRQLATNIYKTKDGRWFALHGSMDPTPTLAMLKVPQHNDKDLAWPQIIDMYADVVAHLDSEILDNESAQVYRLPGTICYDEEEFKNLPHGKAIKDEPYYSVLRQPHYTQPPVSWDGYPGDPSDPRPLSGLKVLDLSRAIAAPTIGRICAALGATVIRVSSSTNSELPITLIDGCIGKTSIDVNLKTFEGRKTLLELIKDADVFVDGYRPSVLEHLGFGRDAVLGVVANREKGIVYCQENCYGWKGPWATRAGWAQIADSVSGVAFANGRFHGFDEPHIFPGPNADYLTGHAGAAGVLQALYLRSRQGGSFVVQCSLLVASLQMQSYGKYSKEQLKSLKARNKSLIGSVRHFDDIVSHGKKQFPIKGFIADRSFDKAFKPEYFQQIDGKDWGLGIVDVVTLPVQFKQRSGQPGMRSDWKIGAYPPGFHEAAWEVRENPEFQPIVSSEYIQS